MAAHSRVIIDVVSHVQNRKKCASTGMEIDRAVRHRAVQVQGDREDRELGGDQEVDQQAAPTGLQKASGEEVEQGSGHYGLRKTNHGGLQPRCPRDG
jgi:hypothetical protein